MNNFTQAKEKTEKHKGNIRQVRADEKCDTAVKGSKNRDEKKLLSKSN